MTEKSDATLVADVLNGRTEAFEDLVHRHQHYAYGTAISVLSDFEMAQDVVQEAFLAAYQELESLRDSTRFGAWVCGIVRHMAHRGLREIARARDMVQSALARLPGKNREVVSLHYVERLSYA